MIALLILLVSVKQTEPVHSNCDIMINESSSNTYYSHKIIINQTKLSNVKHMKILQHSDLFSIDSQSVSLHAIRNIDRENLCKQYKSCDCFDPICTVEVTILIVYFHNDPPYRFSKTVCISDVNDNKPTFPEVIQSLNVNENVDIGTHFELHSATDYDSEQFGVVRYELQCPKDMFNLSYNIPRKGVHRSDHLVRVTVTMTPRYQPEVIVCNLSACDIEFCTTIKLLVRVNDVNDHRPEWKGTEYIYRVQENRFPDSVIGRFEAVDPDPIYGKVSYSISRVIVPLDSKALSDGYFNIDSTTGELRINKYLDYEDPTFRRFDVILVAKDNGTPILSSSVTVQILVENVNDNPPKIILNKSILDVKENSNPTFLDYFTVTDDDEMDNVTITCGVTEPENVFKLKKSSVHSPIIFELYSKEVFDYEKQTTVTMVIRCEDGGAPSLTSVKRISVNILDVNDNPVHFPQKIVHLYISENVPIGTEITKLQSIDFDRKSSLLYTLSDPGNCSFVNLDSYNGYLTSNEEFDREMRDLYVFQVKVEERDNSNFSDVADVYLRITDVNDNCPTFKESYSFSLPENISINTVVGRVQAVDLDFGSNGTVSYYQGMQVGKIPEFFRVDSNGEIRLFQQLDFESQSIYNLIIVARDHGNIITQSSSMSVIIKVIDSNDHPPRFEERTSSLTLPCQTQHIGKDLITTTDRDQARENTQINYEIEKVEPSKYRSVFHINRTTGFLSMIITKAQCKFKFGSREKVDITMKIYDPTKVEFKDRAIVMLYLESDKYDTRVDNNRVNKNDGSNTRNPYNKHKINNDRNNGNQESIDQNVIIVMILIFITIFLGIILISLVCFIKKRRESEEEQDIAESLGIIRDKVNSPLQSTEIDYGKNCESFNLTMKNVVALDSYYPSLADSTKIKTNDLNIASNSPTSADTRIENNSFHYHLTRAKDSNAYQTLTRNPKNEEQYSVIESFLLNSQFGLRDKIRTDNVGNREPGSNSSTNRPYVSVSFV